MGYVKIASTSTYQTPPSKSNKQLSEKVGWARIATWRRETSR